MNKMSWYPGLRPSSTLTGGVVFSFQDEKGTFISWNAPSRSTRFGEYRQANVVNGDGKAVVWSLNMAGSVKI